MKIIQHLKSDWFRYGFETLAVVIGILVAFALDNWSENRKLQKEAANILTEIREDLVIDTSSISRTLSERRLDFEAQSRIIRAIQEDVPFNDQIQSDLGQVMIKRSAQLVSSGFSLLKESRLTSIEDQVLRSALIEYYEQVVLDMEEEYRDDTFEFESVLLPYVRHNFKEWIFGQYGIPLDWEWVKDDHYFLSTLQINLNNLSMTIFNLETGLNSAISLMAILDRRD